MSKAGAGTRGPTLAPIPTMARDYAHHGIRGATDEASNGVEVPEWMEKVWHGRGLDGYAAPVSLDQWGREEATTHDIVNVAFGDGEETGAFELTDENRAVVAESGELVSIVSSRYNLIPNDEVARATRDVLVDFNIADRVYGEARDYTDFITLDLYFDEETAMFQNPDTQDVMAYGIELRAAHDKRSSVRGRIITRDGYCRNTLRGISQVGWRGVRHIEGDDDEDRDTYDEIYELVAALILELCWYADAFNRDIDAASSEFVDFAEEDFSVREFYEAWLGDNLGTNTVIDAAVQRAHYRAGIIEDPDADLPDASQTLSVWALVSGVTYALSHESNISDGSRKDRYHRECRDALAAPAEFVDRVRATHATPEPDIEAEDEEDDLFDRGALTKRELARIGQ